MNKYRQVIDHPESRGNMSSTGICVRNDQLSRQKHE